jgi:hypothetical protein
VHNMAWQGIHLVWSKYPNVLLYCRLQARHDSRFGLNCIP